MFNRKIGEKNWWCWIILFVHVIFISVFLKGNHNYFHLIRFFFFSSWPKVSFETGQECVVNLLVQTFVCYCFWDILIYYYFLKNIIRTCRWCYGNPVIIIKIFVIENSNIFLDLQNIWYSDHITYKHMYIDNWLAQNN